jgi:cell wall-associated NlpC family hydrolase
MARPMTPAIGDFFVCDSFTAGGGFWANLPSKGIQWGTRSGFNHAGIYVGDHQVIEAQPSGVARSPSAQYEGDNTEWSSGYGLDGVRGYEAAQVRHVIADWAVSQLGKPYGWPDIAAITLAQQRLGSRIDVRRALAEQPWWVRRLISPDTLICSQLVALAYQHAGVQLYVDGWLPQLVTPGDLARLLRPAVRPG